MKINPTFARPFIMDGAMATYYLSLPDHKMESCELANLHQPDLIEHIHKEYIEAGVDGILTNTFGLSMMISQGKTKEALKILQAACAIASKASQDRVVVFGDIGPAAPGTLFSAQEVYIMQMQAFIQCGITDFIFETLSAMDGIEQAAKWNQKNNPDGIIIVSYAVGPDDRTRTGQSGQQLLKNTTALEGVFAAGLNCMCGPHHLLSVVQNISLDQKPLIIMPNAGYPDIRGRYSLYKSDPDYFADQMSQIHDAGAVILGGCCGTTPSHIARLRQSLLEKESAPTPESSSKTLPFAIKRYSPSAFWKKIEKKEKVIAVELDPPRNDRILNFMEGIGNLHAAGADLVTIADNPIGRPRADAALLACKIRRELGIEVLPHMTCRDRNLNSARGLLMGLSMEGVHNLLLVTGDPIPSEDREEVKSVFSYNSRKLAQYVVGMYPDMISTPFRIFGALDVNAPNFDVQLRLAKEKQEAGMQCFLSQPVLSQRALVNLKRAREELSSPILAGIMPIVSYKNALFLHNEISGMDIDERIIDMYKDRDRQESEEIAYKCSMAIALHTAPYCDGYYMMTPFHRISLMERIIQGIQENLQQTDHAAL